MIAPIGTRFHYSSATTQILARIVRDLTGGPEQTLAFAWRELFNPLGMFLLQMSYYILVWRKRAVTRLI